MMTIEEQRYARYGDSYEDFLEEAAQTVQDQKEEDFARTQKANAMKGAKYGPTGMTPEARKRMQQSARKI